MLQGYWHFDVTISMKIPPTNCETVAFHLLLCDVVECCNTAHDIPHVCVLVFVSWHENALTFWPHANQSQSIMTANRNDDISILVFVPLHSSTSTVQNKNNSMSIQLR